jgi:hypothetical protein
VLVPPPPPPPPPQDIRNIRADSKQMRAIINSQQFGNNTDI